MARKRNPLMRHFLYALFLLFFKLCQWLPLPLARDLAVALATVGYRLVPRIKKVGMANLDLAYGDTLTAQQKEDILRAATRNLALVAVEFPHIPRLTPEAAPRYVKVKGFGHTISSSGAVLVGAHHGNWEWMLPVVVNLGLKLVVVVRTFDDPRMNAIVDGVRQGCGIKTITKEAAMGPLLRKIREGHHAALLADQNPRENAAPVRFFGVDTWATIGPALIAMRAKVPVLPVSMTRDEEGMYTVEFHPPLEMRRTGNMIADLLHNTQQCQDALERIIRKCPEQWLWFHRRWKRRERLEQEWAARREKLDTADDASRGESDSCLQ